MAKIMYALPASCGFTRKKDQEKLDRLVRRTKIICNKPLHVTKNTRLIQIVSSYLQQPPSGTNMSPPHRKTLGIILEQVRIISSSLLKMKQIITYATHVVL